MYADTNNYDKGGLNLENWENGGYMDKENDIDVIADDNDPMGLWWQYQNQIPT